MNLTDVVLIGAIGGAAYAGWHQGFAQRALSWIGLGAGVVVGALLVDDIARSLRDSTPRTRLLGAIAFLVLVAIAGLALGSGLGALMRRSIPPRLQRSTGDRVAGAIAAVACVAVGVWLLVPAFANTSGWPARAARGSAIARAVEALGPVPPGSLAALGRLVSDAPFPEVFDRLTSPDAGPPPTRVLPAAVFARVSPSVVRVDGQACDLLQQGSGVVVAEDLVLTNAHVVAGEQATTVTNVDGVRHEGVVVGFDPARDLALVRARGLGLAPVERAPGGVDDSGAVIGYPGGGPQLESPARIAEDITATGTDIYRDASTRRSVFVLAAGLAPGDSGGPLVDRAGRVVGLAFAVDPGDPDTAYALTDREISKGLAAFARAGTTASVRTGRCLTS